MKSITKVRLLTVFSLAIVLPVGVLYSRYRFSVSWLNQEMGGIFYVLFWCLLAFLFFPTKKAIWQIPLWVFVMTSMIEFLQLWQTPFLNLIRSYWWGKMLLGSVFTWADFPYYLMGSILGWLWLKLIFGKYPKTL